MIILIKFIINNTDAFATNDRRITNLINHLK